MRSDNGEFTSPGNRPISPHLIVGLLMACAAVMTAGVGLSGDFNPVTKAVFVIAFVAGVVAVMKLRSRALRIVEVLSGDLRPLESWIDDAPIVHRRWMVFLASLLALYFELVIIRWHASCFQLFAYYKNVSLVSCFMGLGIGFALGRRRRLLTPLLLPALSLQFIVMHLIRFTSFDSILDNPVPSNLALGLGSNQLLGADHGPLPGLLIAYGFLLIVFVVNAMVFVPFGQLIESLMAPMPRLEAYGWNLFGSMSGVAAFSALGAVWSPPTIWFLLGALGLLPLLIRATRALAIGAAFALVAVVVLNAPLRFLDTDLYSPYQILTLSLDSQRPPLLKVNHTYYQRILDLRQTAIAGNDLLQRRAAYYELPYTLHPRARSVLVLGSGLGNDVAAALRRGCERVDAVEIDPAIFAFGSRLHVEQPYADPRVHSHITDARRYLRSCSQRYDLVVYGLLDSHTLLTSRSSVRLDSFVYTTEAFTEARKLLADDGLLSVSFALMSREQGKKLITMLTDASDGTPPRVFLSGYDMGFTFLAGPGLDTLDLSHVPFPDVGFEFDRIDIDADPATDDWPFLYLARRGIPVSYLTMILVLIVVSGLVIWSTVWHKGTRMSWPCFFLGAGFMLVETKGITEFGLILGGTWQVISAVILAILVLAYVSNFVVLKLGGMQRDLTYILLVVAVAAGLALFGLSAGWASHHPTVFLVTLVLPVFFSGLAFSSEIRRSDGVGAALSSNLMGAMVGGFLEYSSLSIGFDALYGVAIGIYLLAWIASRRA